MSEQVTLTCRACGRPMVERKNGRNGSAFMGCTGYPEFCNETAKLPAYLEMKRAGGIELPGLGNL